MEVDDVLTDDELKSRLAAVGAGILVIIAGFLVYNYFSNVGREESVLEEAAVTEETEEQETEGETVEEQGEVAGEETTEETEEMAEEDQGTGGPESSVYWTANDYQNGDISGEEYTVKDGDTLWEIAEARYGSGFEWTKIRDANSDQIGTLPNGSQALIVPGQTLTLP